MAASIESDLFYSFDEGVLNSLCADCSDDNPEWLDTLFEVFICERCSKIRSELKIPKMDLICLKNDPKNPIITSAKGNVANEVLEQELPTTLIKQGKNTHEAILKQFIILKYKDKIFSSEQKCKNYDPLRGEFKGYLMKKAKCGEKWNLRLFILKDGKLDYYLHDDDINPKVSLSVYQIEVFIENLDESTFKMALSYADGDTNRSYYLLCYAEIELFNWNLAIIIAKSKKPKNSLCNFTFKISGYLYKVGTGRYDRWKKRWVTLSNLHCMYYKNKFSSHSQGEIIIGSNETGYSVEPGPIHHKVIPPFEHTFQVTTPTRTYKFCAETKEEEKSWVLHFNQVITNNSKSFKGFNTM